MARAFERDDGGDGLGDLRLGALAQTHDPARLNWLLAQMRAAGQIPGDAATAAAAAAIYRTDLLVTSDAPSPA